MIRKIIGLIVSFILMLSFSQTMCLGSTLLNMPIEGSSITKNLLIDLVPYFYIYGFGSNIKYKGEYNNTNKVDIIIANHINTIDFCINLSIIRQFDNRDIYFILKKGVLFIPGVGSILTNSNDIKLNKKIEDDISNIENSIKNIKDGLIIILPEGTRYTPEKHVISKQFSLDNKLPVFTNMLYPKMKGLFHICNILKENNKLGNIIDFTNFIKNLHLKKCHMDKLLTTKFDDTYSIINSYIVPIDKLSDYNNFKEWFLNIWKKKDNILDNININNDKLDYKKIKAKLRLHRLLITIIILAITIHMIIISKGLFIPASLFIMCVFSFIKYKQLKKFM
jgi:1-acyl-sn-glycerol-3-phosphate acyltransferase